MIDIDRVTGLRGCVWRPSDQARVNRMSTTWKAAFGGATAARARGKPARAGRPRLCMRPTTRCQPAARPRSCDTGVTRLQGWALLEHDTVLRFGCARGRPSTAAAASLPSNVVPCQWVCTVFQQQAGHSRVLVEYSRVENRRASLRPKTDRLHSMPLWERSVLFPPFADSYTTMAAAAGCLVLPAQSWSAASPFKGAVWADRGLGLQVSAALQQQPNHLQLASFSGLMEYCPVSLRNPSEAATSPSSSHRPSAPATARNIKKTRSLPVHGIPPQHGHQLAFTAGRAVPVNKEKLSDPCLGVQFGTAV